MDIVRTDNEIRMEMDALVALYIAIDSTSPGLRFEQGATLMYNWLTGADEKSPSQHLEEAA